MNDESIIINDRGLARRLNRLHFIRKFYLTIGHAATRGQFVVNRSVRAGSDDSSSMRFIRSLQEMARKPQTEQAHAPKSGKDLEEVLERSNQVIARATSIFPLTLFPDTVILDRTKLTVIKRNFFLSEDVMSIRIEDILNVSTTIGPIFGSITIATRVMSSTDHFTIRNFFREDVMRLSHMIQGYVIARHNNIECDHLSYDELVHTLQELGHESGKHKTAYFTPARSAQK